MNFSSSCAAAAQPCKPGQRSEGAHDAACLVLLAQLVDALDLVADRGVPLLDLFEVRLAVALQCTNLLVQRTLPLFLGGYLRLVLLDVARQLAEPQLQHVVLVLHARAGEPPVASVRGAHGRRAP